MLDEALWTEIRRFRDETRVSIPEIVRRLDLDLKTVRRSLRQTTWQPYRRAAGLSGTGPRLARFMHPVSQFKKLIEGQDFCPHRR